MASPSFVDGWDPCSGARSKFAGKDGDGCSVLTHLRASRAAWEAPPCGASLCSLCVAMWGLVHVNGPVRPNGPPPEATRQPTPAPVTAAALTILARQPAALPCHRQNSPSPTSNLAATVNFATGLRRVPAPFAFSSHRQTPLLISKLPLRYFSAHTVACALLPPCHDSSDVDKRAPLQHRAANPSAPLGCGHLCPNTTSSTRSAQPEASLWPCFFPSRKKSSALGRTSTPSTYFSAVLDCSIRISPSCTPQWRPTQTTS